MFSLGIFYLTKLCNGLLIFFGSTKIIKNWNSDDGPINKSVVAGVLCRDHAKLVKEDDYYNMVKVILCSILFSFFYVLINNASIILFVLTF